MIRLLVAIALIAAPEAVACTTDGDCTAPDTCHFASATVEGQCLDTTQLALRRGERTLPPLRERRAGDVCQFSVDCAVGMNCYKAPGAAEGKCFAPVK